MIHFINLVAAPSGFKHIKPFYNLHTFSLNVFPSSPAPSLLFPLTSSFLILLTLFLSPISLFFLPFHSPSSFTPPFHRVPYPRLFFSVPGCKHVKGILLFGPPGCGKTLMARQIGKMLNAREPKIVNGPEILNKYVGESEANIRKLFADAEEEQKRVSACFLVFVRITKPN